MPQEGKNYTPEFKKKIAQQALKQDRKNVDQLSEQHDVPVSVILMWTTELEKGGEDVFKTAAEDAGQAADEPAAIDVTVSDEEVASSMEHGVMSDKLNYKRLTFWSVLGVILVIIFVQALFEMYQYNERALQDRVSAESGEFYQANQLKKEAEDKLSSFGVINLEEGTYRMPIDSVISDMAVDEE